MPSVIDLERRTHIIQDAAEAIAIAQQLSAEFAKESAERDRERRLPFAELDKLSKSGLLGIRNFDSTNRSRVLNPGALILLRNCDFLPQLFSGSMWPIRIAQ